MQRAWKHKTVAPCKRKGRPKEELISPSPQSFDFAEEQELDEVVPNVMLTLAGPFLTSMHYQSLLPIID